MVVTAASSSYKGHRYPPEIIAHCVWLYHRFPLSFREVEELMLQRGVVVSYETIRQWCAKFGQVYANRLRRRRARPGLATNGISMKSSSKINGTIHYLWRGRPARQCARRPGAVTPTRGGRQEVLPPTAHGTAVRAAGARHRQARQLRAGPPRGDALGGTPAIEVSEHGPRTRINRPGNASGR